MVQLLFARLPQFKDDNTSISSTKRVKDLSTKNINHQRVNSKSFINEQQINRKIILFFHCCFFKVLFYRINFIYNRNKFNICKFSRLSREYQKTKFCSHHP